MSKTPKKVVESLNKEYYIPVIQRRFVWDTEQISMLFDSMLRKFPIGQMLLKESNKKEVNNNPTYGFVTNYIIDEVENINNASYKNELVDKVESNPVGLIFDGQQRLTALNIGLNGSIYKRDNKYTEKKSDNYTQKFFCMNILSNPESPVENSDSFDQSKGGDAPRYEFAFKKQDNISKLIKSDNDDEDKIWYKVSNILEEDDMLSISIGDYNISSEQKSYAKENLQRLFYTIHTLECIDIKEVSNKNKDEMLEIFVRMNRSGTQISDTDTALSILTYRWQKDSEKVNLIARDEIEDFKYELNQMFGSKSNPITNEMVLQGAMVCANVQSDEIDAPRVKIEKFTDKNNKLSNIIKDIWKDSSYKRAMRKYVKTMKEFGIPNTKIKSTVYMCPTLLFIYLNKETIFDESSELGLKNRQRVLYWICSAPILGITGHATMKLSKDVMEVIIKEESESFPLEEIDEELSPDLSIKIDSEILKAHDIHENFYNRRNSLFLNLLINIDKITNNKSINIRSYHQDHIFPQSKFDNNDKPNIEHRLGNIQYIPNEVNAEKSDMEFSKWINTRTKDYKDEYFIPMNDNLYNKESFNKFITKRENKIRMHLEEISDTLINSNSIWKR